MLHRKWGNLEGLYRIYGRKNSDYPKLLCLLIWYRDESGPFQVGMKGI